PRCRYQGLAGGLQACRGSGAGYKRLLARTGRFEKTDEGREAGMTDDPQATTELSAMPLAEILEALPHRYPFLMIDKIVRIDRDETAVGIKNVTYNEPIFQGHFPGNP